MRHLSRKKSFYYSTLYDISRTFRELISFHIYFCPLYQESFFQWCFAVEEPGCHGALDLDNGLSILFVPRLPPEYAIWEGKLHTLDELKERYGVDETYYTDEIARVLKEKRARLLLTLVSLACKQTFTVYLLFRCGNMLNLRIF